MGDSIWSLVVASLACAAITKTINKHLGGVTRFKVLDCRYCLSHWVALAIVLVYNAISVINWPLLYWFVYWFAIVGGSSIVLRLIKPIDNQEGI